MAVTITDAAAVVPTMMTTGLTGATVGAVATVSDLHARTVAVAETTAAVTTPVAAVAVTPATIIAADAVATLAGIIAAVTDAV